MAVMRLKLKAAQASLRNLAAMATEQAASLERASRKTFYTSTFMTTRAALRPEQRVDLDAAIAAGYEPRAVKSGARGLIVSIPGGTFRRLID
eukprot:14127820-Alexandrium_andersonii.AAC.1